LPVSGKSPLEGVAGVMMAQRHHDPQKPTQF
jgi:hypothetical protein